MRFGIHTGQQDCAFDDLRQLWRLADRSGFDWVSVWDHFYETMPRDGNGSTFEAVSTMAALAGETKRVRVGCLVFCMAFRSPAMLAKAAATLDHISGGRVELGLGAGWVRSEFEDNGYIFAEPKVRLDMLEEGLRIIKGMLGPDAGTTFNGKHFQVNNARCFPKPLQARLPIWVGGGGERRTLRIVARYADGWNDAYVGPDVFSHKSGVLDRWCEQEGRNPAEIARSANIGFYMGTDAESARRRREEYPSSWGKGFRSMRDGMLFGTPEEAIESVARWAQSGAQQINLCCRAPFDLDAVQAFAEIVMPRFR